MNKCLECGDPTPRHGFRNTYETVVGTVVFVSCNEGYNLLGDAILTCQSDKSWTDIPTCEIIGNCCSLYPSKSILAHHTATE